MSEFVGYSVALNASGDVALVGAPAFNVSFNQGTAYVFQKRGGSWIQQQELHGSGGPTFDQFGYSVALNASGNVALVGAPDSSSGVHPGAAFVFEERGGSWIQQQELHATDGAPGDNFGFSAALSASGNVAIVGAFQGGYIGGSRPGAAYVFQQHGAGWAQQQKLQSGDGDLDDEFGISVALSAVGDVVIVGADGKDEYAGRAFVFQERGGSWTQQQELRATDGVTFDGFGFSVALNASGNVALAGAPGRAFQGAAFVFERRGGSWTQQKEIRADDVNFNFFGLSVALNASGNIALVGAAYKDGDTGAAYVFQERGGSWTQQQELRASDGTSGDDFGWSVALSAGGNVALVGAPGLFNSGTNPGAAYVYNGK